MHPFHHGAGLGALVGRPFGDAVEDLPAVVDASPGASEGGEVVGAYALPRILAGLEQALVAEELVGLCHAGEAAVHLVDLAVADQGYVIVLAGEGDELQAGGVVQLEDAAVYHLLHLFLRPLEVEVAEGVEHAAAGHSAVHSRLGYLDALVEYGPVQELDYAEGAVGIFRVACGYAGLGEALDEVGHDPGVPVHRHRFGRRAVVVALVFAVASEVAVLFLAGDEIIGHGREPCEDCGIARALVGLGGGVHPLSGVLALPSALALGYHFRREQLDCVALGAVDVLCETAVISGIHRVAEHSADHDTEKEIEYHCRYCFVSIKDSHFPAFLLNLRPFMKTEYVTPDSLVLSMDYAVVICATSSGDASLQDYPVDDEGNFFSGL